MGHPVAGVLKRKKSSRFGCSFPIPCFQNSNFGLNYRQSCWKKKKLQIHSTAFDRWCGQTSLRMTHTFVLWRELLGTAIETADSLGFARDRRFGFASRITTLFVWRFSVSIQIEPRWALVDFSGAWCGSSAGALENGEFREKLLSAISTEALSGFFASL